MSFGNGFLAGVVVTLVVVSLTLSIVYSENWNSADLIHVDADTQISVGTGSHRTATVTAPPLAAATAPPLAAAAPASASASVAMTGVTTTAKAASATHYIKAGKPWNMLPRSELIDTLAQIMAQPPKIAASATCSNPPIMAAPKCTEIGFSGKRPTGEVGTVYRVMPFGYEADTLEIALREYQGLNVKAILIESALTHKEPFQHKSSQWDRIKNQSRFDGLRDMVILRSTMPAAFIRKFSKDAMWASERAQERYGLDDAKAVLGNKFRPTDVLVMGSPDEILSRHIMHSLSHCQLKDAMVGAAVGFPFGFVERAFRPDFRPGDLTYSFTLPTAYSIGKFPYEKIIRYFQPPNKGLYLQGGMHLTGYTLLAATLIKDVSTTDHDGQTTRIEQLCAVGPASIRKALHAKMLGNSGRVTDVATLSEHERASYVIPWFLECNRERYPSWFKDASIPDSRDDDVHRILCPKK